MTPESTHATEYPLMACEYPLLGLAVHFHRFNSALERTAKNDSVVAREHIKSPTHDCVINFRLRNQHVKLALDRHEFTIAEQLATNVCAGTITSSPTPTPQARNDM